MISVLGVMPGSNYYKIEGLDLWDKERNAYNFKGNNMVICHAPCQQWSRLKAFAKPDHDEKNLAYFCWDVVNRNGGIFEHPAGSSFFKEVNADRKKMFKVNQSWWGFGAKKETILYCHNVKLLSYPLCFNAIKGKVHLMNKGKRSRMEESFCRYLVDCILHSSIV